jgi:hypothetical protein
VVSGSGSGSGVGVFVLPIGRYDRLGVIAMVSRIVIFGANCILFVVIANGVQDMLSTRTEGSHKTNTWNSMGSMLTICMLAIPLSCQEETNERMCGI